MVSVISYTPGKYEDCWWNDQISSMGHSFTEADANSAGQEISHLLLNIS
jgi:hypothetical protein